MKKMTLPEMAAMAQRIEQELGWQGSLREQFRMFMVERAAVYLAEPRTQERETAYRAIDSERAYQDVRWGRTTWIPSAAITGSSTNGSGSRNRSIDEFALYVEGYARDLAALASHTNEPKAKLHFFRKVAALCVACMEQHGAPLRDDGAGNLGSRVP